MLEEAYLYIDMPAPAFGVQLVYTDPHEPELATIVREGDVVLMPQGYHPNVAAPGGSINFLWMMAANREREDRQYGVVNVQPDFAQARLGPRGRPGGEIAMAAARVGIVAIAAVLCLSASPRAVDEPKALDARALTAEIDQFLLREATAHFAAIPALDPPPDRVLGARTVGEFSWGTFMRALAAIAQHANAPTLADRDVPQWVGRMGLIEARAGSKAFSQMYAALALQHYGENLDQNPVWQKLTPGRARRVALAARRRSASTIRSTGA